MKTKEINRIIGIYTEHIAGSNVSDLGKNASLFIINLLKKELKAKQERKQAKKKALYERNKDVINIIPIAGLFESLQSDLDRLTTNPCNEKFNPGANCCNELDNIGGFKLAMVPNESEHTGYEYYKFENGEWSKIHETEFDKIQKEISSKFNKDKGSTIELIESLNKNITLKDKLIIEHDETITQKNVIIDEQIETIESLQKKITGLEIKYDSAKIIMSHKDKQIASQAETITRLTNKVKDLMEWRQEKNKNE